MIRAFGSLGFLVLAIQICVGSSVIPFKLVNGLMIVEARVDHKVAPFIFDTGASDIILHSGEQVADAHFSTISGSVDAGQIFVDKITLAGGMTVEKLHAYSADLSHLQDYLTMDIGGIIGGEALFHDNIYIDYDKGIISIGLSPSEVALLDLGSAMDLVVDGDMLFTTSVIGGIKLNMLLDSGATSHVLNEGLADKISGMLMVDTNKGLTTAGGVTAVQRVGYSDMLLTASLFQEQRFLFQSLNQLQGETLLNIDGLISISSLSKHQVFLDIANLKLFIK